MERWTRFVLRRRWPVIAAWIVLFVVSGWASSGLSKLLTNRFSIPGSDTARAEKILHDQFGQRSDGSFQLIFKAADGTTAKQALPRVAAAAERAAATVPTGKFVSAEPVAPTIVSALVTSALEPADAKNYTDEVREAAGTVPNGTLYVTGAAAITSDLDPVFNDDIKKGELYIAIPIAFVILLFVFGTLTVLVPLVFALAAIPTTLAAVWIFANFMELSTYLQNMVTLIGLGIAIDYSLLVVYRFREERAAGDARDEAIVRTMKTAGRAVVFSGTAVGIGLALMLAMPLPFLRGFGIGGLIIPLVSVACALTLLPALLSLVGDRLESVRIVPKAILERRADEEHNMWARLARLIMRRPVPVALVTTALLVALAIPVFSLQVGPGTNKGIPQDLPSVRGLNILASALGEGALSPTEVAIDTQRSGGVQDPAVREAVARLVAETRRDPEVTSVIGASLRPPYVDPTGRYIHLQVTGKHEYGTPEAQDFARRFRSTIVPAAGFPPAVDVFAGGGPPSSVDVIDASYGAFPWLVLAVLVATYFLLLRAFRSLLLPLKAIILNCLSIGAAYGLLVIVFKWGGGSALGLQSFDQIEFWIPIFLFAMLFGLSMDYEVFLVSRMREEWDKTHDNEHSVALGLAKTGRIVTAAGLIMFAAFMGFVAGSILGLQQFGFGLAAAIIIDVTLIRALLVPSAMALFGRWNWWLPTNVARVFRVKPSPLEHGRPALGSSGR
ncbi:MAG TPA: MMPL family transporter [Gaiellaceae bacterium]|jgi:RND superfamily putative drug exporter